MKIDTKYIVNGVFRDPNNFSGAYIDVFIKELHDDVISDWMNDENLNWSK